MKEETYEFASLVSGYLHETLSKEQEECLMQILEKDEDKRKLLEYYKQTAPAQERLDYISRLNVDLAWSKVSQRYQDKHKKTKYRFLRYAAAAVLVLGSLGIWIRYANEQDKPGQVTASVKYTQDVLPGGNVAVLVLSDGSKVSLDSGQVSLKEKDGTRMSGRKGGLSYTPRESSSPMVQLYNTLIVPKAGTYQLTLPDGTSVWLNAMSQLRFPVSFSSKERKVELRGEAYFEVAKNSKVPFKVVTGNQEIEVKGTHFNISSYPDEAFDKTTLLEGSVKVSEPGVPSRSWLLKPGQEAKIDKHTHQTVVASANIKEAIAWQKGYFLFNDEKLESIMARVARWYDVEVVYEGKIEDQSFLGQLERSKNISSVLELLEQTGNVHFKISGRRIVVMP